MQRKRLPTFIIAITTRTPITTTTMPYARSLRNKKWKDGGRRKNFSLSIRIPFRRN